MKPQECDAPTCQPRQVYAHLDHVAKLKDRGVTVRACSPRCLVEALHAVAEFHYELPTCERVWYGWGECSCSAAVHDDGRAEPNDTRDLWAAVYVRTTTEAGGD